MATESQLVPQVVALAGGLNFSNAKLTTEPGTLSDCYNYEVTDRDGYFRIKGYERFDGDVAPSLVYTNSITLTHSAKTYPGTLPHERSPLFVDGAEVAFGYLVTRGANSSVVVVTNFEEATPLIAFLQNPTGTFDITSPDASTTWAITGFVPNVGADAQITTNNRNTQFNNIAARVDSIDSDSFQSPVIGLRWYKDQLYAIRNLNVLKFNTGSKEVFPNETIVDASALEAAFKVLKIELTSGAWASGNAAGYIYTYGEAIVPGSAYTIVDRSISNAFVAVASQPTAQELNAFNQNAGIWRSFSRVQADEETIAPGWHPVDMGYQLTFSGGTSSGPPLVYSRGEVGSVTAPIDAVSTPGTVATAGVVTWTLEGGASSELDAVVTDDQEFIEASTTLVNPATIAQVTNFSSANSIPKGAVVTGVSLKLSIAAPIRVASAKIPYFLTRAISASGELGNAKSTPDVRTTAGAFSAADIYVLGGEGDNWGIDNLQEELINGFGFNIAPRARGGSGAETIDYQINYVEITVYYTATTQDAYFWNGTDDVKGSITNYYVDEGDWTTNDAHGYMQVYDLVGQSTTRNYVEAGDQIRTLPGGGGNLIATVETGAVSAALPGLYLLEQNQSRYQMIVANFFAQESWEAIYGVSGASRAFAYDGFYFRWIYTGLAPAMDHPRHIEIFQKHLILGYKAGNIKISKVLFPEEFRIDRGAADIPTGDSVTGLIRMNGSTLAIGCQSSVQSLTGSSIDDFTLRVLNPYDNVIEYSVVDCGRAVYCSTAGISLFEQTAAYGDFKGVRLSEPIASWLIPRLQGTVPPLNAYIDPDQSLKIRPVFINQSASNGILMAYPCRSSNQYRLVLKDGTVVSMTLLGPEQRPAFTIQVPIIHNDDGASFEDPYSTFIPRAECSSVDSTGTERIHLAHYNKFLDTPNSDNLYYVYEFERSWTFDGRGIPSYFTTSSNFKDTPFQYGAIRKCRVHGLSMGYAPNKLFMAKDYDSAIPTDEVAALLNQPANLPNPAAYLLTGDLIPYTSMVNYSKEGYCVSMTFFNYETMQGGGPYAFKRADPSPPHAIQTLLIQYVPGRGDK